MANEQEHHRFSVSAEIEEKALREIYLRPFEMLVKSETPPACFMTAYNRVNGSHMDMHAYLLKTVLRDQWGFKGLVMSDWGGTNSTDQSVLAGCDLEMPGPALRRGSKLVEALNGPDTGDLKLAVDLSCRRVLDLAEKSGKSGLSAQEAEATRDQKESSATNDADVATLRHIAARGMVLLKNEHRTLPLNPSLLQGKKIAFVGPNAFAGASNGGGSAAMNPQYLSQPYESFRTILNSKGFDATLGFTSGCRSHKWLPLLSGDQWQAPDEPLKLLRVDFFSSIDCTGEIVETQYRDNSNIDLFDSGPESLRNGGRPYSLQMRSVLTPTTSGDHAFGVSSVGGAKLFVDGSMVLENSTWTGLSETFYAFGSPEVCVNVRLEAQQSYEVVLEAWSESGNADVATDSVDIEPMHVYGAQPSTRLGYLEEERNSIAEAVELAKASDITVVVLGLSEEWESEGYDRKSMALPGKQNELVRALLDNVVPSNQIIIVNQSGSPVEMPWASDAPTILQAWYGGQEAGNALADVLLGASAPNGRLPMTWPYAYSDLPFASDESSWPGVHDIVKYKEGTSVGYRWFLETDLQPQWWFGYGLGYSKFSHEIKSISSKHDCWDLEVQITNIGDASSEEVVQAYVWPSGNPSLRMLAGFDRTEMIQPTAAVVLKIEILQRNIARWANGKWLLSAGSYTVALGRHAGDDDATLACVDNPNDLFWLP